MELTSNIYTQIAAAVEEYAIQNKDTNKNSINLAIQI